jgi:hypothetical protein
MTSFLRKSASKVGSRNADEPCTPEDEQAKVDELRAAIGPLTGRLDIFADDACLKRYLRARSWNLKKSEKMLKDTLAWRETYKPEDIRWTDVAGESETGKLYRANFKDKDGHTVLVMHPGRQNTNNAEMQMKQLVYFLENAVLNLPVGQEQMIWLIDFKGWSIKKSSPLSVARETVHIFQNHYPERLNLFILYNPPRVFETFFSLVKPFLDPNTVKKIRFIHPKNSESTKILSDLFEEDIVKIAFEDPNDYNHEEYSKLMKDDDLKSSLHWKGAGKSKPDHAAVQIDSDVPSVEVATIENTTSNGPVEGAPVEEAPAVVPEAKEVPPPASDPEVVPAATPVATLVAAPAPAPVVAPVS